MKKPFYCIFGLTLTCSTFCFGQVDIYQSDAYSVEEMCAREAEQEQNESLDYNDAYDACISKNAERDMYQSDRVDEEHESSDEEYAEE